jgi:P-type E1-E2 ATPase
MIEVVIPGRQIYRFQHLVLDLNGTITSDGKVIAGVEERLAAVKKDMHVTIVTADTRGSASALEQVLKVKVHKVDTGNEDVQKLALVEELGKEHTVCIGNGANDISMLKEAALGICVIGTEGASAETMKSADLVVTDINNALDLLLYTERLVATLRK